jgi:AbrB family looped-hinge helix DNA binding protein
MSELMQTEQYNIRVRQRGQMTIPHKVRDELLIEEGDVLTLVRIGDTLLLSPASLKGPELADEFARLMAEKELSLADLLADLPQIREEIYRERYGKDET